MFTILIVKKIISRLGKRLNYEVSRNKCFICERNKNKDKKIDKDTRALIKMYEREEKEIREHVVCRNFTFFLL